jgi:osmotically-inducible protein OsmY
MKHEEPKPGRPGETSQWPRWEGPAENRPSGYLQGEANIFADTPEQEKKRGVAPADYDRPDPDIEAAVKEALTQDSFLDPTAITVSVKDGVVSLDGSVASEADLRRAEKCIENVHGVRSCSNNLIVAGERH